MMQSINVKTVCLTQIYSVWKIEFMITLWFLTNFCAILAFTDLTAVHYSIVSPGIDQNVTAGTLQQKVSKNSLYMI